MALNPIFLIVAAVVAIIAVLVILQKEFGLFDGVIRVVGDAFAAVWAAIKTVFDWVKDNWQLLLVILTGPFGLALAFVITFKDQIIGFIKGVIDWITNNWKLILAILTGPFGLAIAFVMKFKDDIWNLLKIAKTGIATIMGGVADVIFGPFKTAFNAIAKLWNNTVGKLSFTVPGWVPGIGGKGFDVPDIPMLENGGIVTKATLAMIGEGNEPEAVIPLSKLGSMGFGGGGGNTFNVTVTSADPNAVVAALQRYVRMSGPVPVTTRPL
jgi:hypothetical protein